MKCLRLTLASLLTIVSVLALRSASPVQADTILHIPPGPGAMGVFWGPDRPRFGETFKAPNDNTLDSFAFHSITAMSDHYFRGYIMAWDGTAPTGPVLYQSGVQHVRASDFVAYPYDNPFDTGGTQLVAGQEYIAFLSISGVPGNTAAGAGDASLGVHGFNTPADDPYPDGTLVWEQASSSGSEWVPVGGTDADFDARFSPSPAPEPCSLTLLALGGLPLFAALRRRVTR